MTNEATNVWGARQETSDKRMTTSDRLKTMAYVMSLEHEDAQRAAKIIDDAWAAGFSREACIEKARTGG